MKIQCLIIDDEQLARNMLEAYAARIPDLEVVAKCKSAANALPYLIKNKIDLLFLDIQMPGMTGIDFLRQMQEPPKVIFTTAYSDYALESYELKVVDYLLKPIGFDRFEKAVDNAKQVLSTEQKAQAFDDEQTFESRFLLVKEGYNHHHVYLKDIRYIIAMREYVQYHCVDGKIMELKSISAIETLLPFSYFIRIHRSYIVAKSEVSGQDRNNLLLKNGELLPLGKTYKKHVLRSLFSERK